MLRSPVGSLVPRQARKCQGHDAEGEGKGQPDNRRARGLEGEGAQPGVRDDRAVESPLDAAAGAVELPKAQQSR